MVESEKYVWLEDPDEHGWVPGKYTFIQQKYIELI